MLLLFCRHSAMKTLQIPKTFKLLQHPQKSIQIRHLSSDSYAQLILQYTMAYAENSFMAKAFVYSYQALASVNCLEYTGGVVGTAIALRLITFPLFALSEKLVAKRMIANQLIRRQVYEEAAAHYGEKAVIDSETGRMTLAMPTKISNYEHLRRNAKLQKIEELTGKLVHVVSLQSTPKKLLAYTMTGVTCAMSIGITYVLTEMPAKMPLPLKNFFPFTTKLAKSCHLSSRFLGFKAPSVFTKESPVVGLFGNFLLQTPKGFELLTQAVNARSGELKCTTVQLIDDLSNEICTAADLTDCVRCMHLIPQFTEAAEKSMRFFTCLVETLNTTPELYFALKRSLETESARLDPVSLRTAKMLLQDFELSGVLLSDSERQRFVQLSNEIYDAGTKFVAGYDKPVELTQDDKKDFPQELKDLEILDGPLLQHDDAKLRKFTFNKFYRHNDEQELLLKRLISSRHQMAQMTGFPTFAHRAQINSILGDYENAHKFLMSVIEGFSSQIEDEVEQIRDLANSNSKNVTDFRTVGLADIEFAVKVLKIFS
uniref:Peptidase M3A/M3B catalytic domain-containing protein n=1 Tax=Meloidogyne javanica TaxID=6303 RepID=A0A915N1I1_MELJA